ncbi:MAG: hypothetical protein QM654_18155, partial [Dysgonamonadaceae bacterium]
MSTEKDRSSGVAVGMPSYEYIQSQMDVDYDGILPHQYPDLHTVSRTSNSIRPISSEDSHICYSEVSKYDDTGSKTVFYFTNSKMYPDILFPRGATNISKSYKRGILTQSTNIDKNSKTVSSVVNNYNFNRIENRNGIGAIMLVEYSHKDIRPDYSTYKGIWMGTILSEWNTLESKVEQKDGVTTATTYYYDNPLHVQLTRSITDVNNKEIQEFTTFPEDFSNTDTADFIGAMKNRHLLEAPIEKIKCVRDKNTNNIYIVDGEVYTYKKGSQTGLLESVYKLETLTPIPFSSFKFANRNSIGESPWHDSLFSSFSIEDIDARYSKKPERTFLRYNLSNNVLEMETKDNLHVSYLWSYLNQYPIAEIKNATYEQVRA